MYFKCEIFGPISIAMNTDAAEVINYRSQYREEAGDIIFHFIFDRVYMCNMLILFIYMISFDFVSVAKLI